VTEVSFYEREQTVKAHAGDRIIVAAASPDAGPRDGEVLETRGPNGTPPFLVRWSDTGHVALLFPGSDAQIHGGDFASEATGENAEAIEVPHLRSWSVTVDIFESSDKTSAHAVLDTDSPTHLHGSGEVRRLRRESVAEVDDEVAVGRALRNFSDQPLDTASSDAAAIRSIDHTFLP
jgi:hypothetical protein